MLKFIHFALLIPFYLSLIFFLNYSSKLIFEKFGLPVIALSRSNFLSVLKVHSDVVQFLLFGLPLYRLSFLFFLETFLFKLQHAVVGILELIHLGFIFFSANRLILFLQPSLYVFLIVNFIAYFMQLFCFHLISFG